MRVPPFRRDLPHRRQHPQHVQEAGTVVGALQWAHGVGGGEGGGDGGGNEGGEEEGAVEGGFVRAGAEGAGGGLGVCWGPHFRGLILGGVLGCWGSG